MQLTNKKYKQHQYFATYIEESGKPYPLAANKGKSFQGSIVLGKGFLLLPEDAQKLIEKDPRNKDVLFPYLNGDDLNNDPEQKPSRWVINFFDWDEEKAKTYPDCYEIVERLVKPERMKLDADKSSTNKKRKTYWWQYGSDAKSLYNTISGLDQVIVINRYTKHLVLDILLTRIVFSDSIIVLTINSWLDFSILSSSIHEVWAWKNSSTIGRGLRYMPTDVFETFPFPPPPPSTSANVLEEKAKDFYNTRKKLMLNQNVGLTKLYNQFHNNNLVQDIYDKDVIKFIESMRTLQQEIDYEVLKLYGWSDIDLNHSFYQLDYLPENDNIRFSISTEARKEILKRLLLLNKTLYSEEQYKVLSSQKKKVPKKTINSNENDLFSNF